jgi:putative two-component system response regulator
MKILLVEDDQPTRDLLDNNLRKWGYGVCSVGDGLEAWELIHHTTVDLVVTDWLMPKLDGLELLRRIRDANFNRYVYTILIGSMDARKAMTKAQSGAVDDFLAKPIDLEELKARIAIGIRVMGLEMELGKKHRFIEKNHSQMIRMLIQLMDAFDDQLGGHCRRVGQLALDLAKRHGDVRVEDCALAQNAGLLHDIGMVGLPAGILAKRRTEMVGDEQRQYQSHCIRGASILNEIESLMPVARIVRLHHEQYNGKGFPDGLQGTQIPLLSQIVAAASIYDNLLHRGRIPLQGIPDRLQRLRGYQLDPGLVDLLLEYSMENRKNENLSDDVPVDVEDLMEGMLLAQDIQMRTGAMVMAAGTQLSAYGIDKLKAYCQLSAISKQILIYKDSIRG